MNFGVAMAPLYISTLLSGSATRYFHYDEDGTNMLHLIREVGMLQSACFTASPTAATLFRQAQFDELQLWQSSDMQEWVHIERWE
jgi:hypothetical protein